MLYYFQLLEGTNEWKTSGVWCDHHNELLAILEFLDQNYLKKFIAIQINHDADRAPNLWNDKYVSNKRNQLQYLPDFCYYFLFRQSKDKYPTLIIGNIIRREATTLNKEKGNEKTRTDLERWDTEKMDMIDENWIHFKLSLGWRYL